MPGTFAAIDEIFDSKTAKDLIRAKNKRSPSYFSEYEDFSYEELIDLSKNGDSKAKKMLKLIKESKRLGNKSFGGRR